MRRNPWLICGGWLSLAAASAHIACIFGGPDWYRFFGAGEPSPVRGINSFQLVRHGGRWWVVSIMWQAETPQTPIPAEYLASPLGGERG